MAHSNCILVSYQQRKFIHQLPSSLDEIKQAACVKFSLNNSAKLVLQSFNKTWGEYIDVSNGDEIIPGLKYRVILQLPTILYSEKCYQQEFNSTDIICQDLQDDTSEEFSFPNSIEFTEPFSPVISKIVENKLHFSRSLEEALKDNIKLSRVLRSELVTAYCKSIMQNSKYPSSIMVTDAARKIIADFPYLKESIGNGYSGWRQSIRDRLKNLRKFDDSEEVRTEFTEPLSPDLSNIVVNEHFSSSLDEALKSNIKLSRVLRSELVTAYCKSITQNTKYPSSIMLTDAARKIIADFPFLKESIGNGYSGWRQSIRDRLKNLRRFDDSEEVRSKKKLKTSENPLIIDKEASNDVVAIFTKQNVDPSKLDVTFEMRRKDIIIGKMKISTLKSNFPGLFNKLELEKEFERVTGKRHLFQSVTKFLDSYCEKLNNLLSTGEKKLPSWVQATRCQFDGSNQNVQAVKEMLVLITLPVHFSEEQLALTYSPIEAEKFTKEGSGLSSPHIGIVGLEYNRPQFFVLAEYEVVIELSTLPEAVAILFSSYFIFHYPYPKQWKKTLLFLENFVFEMDSKSLKMPVKVVNFIKKLKN